MTFTQDTRTKAAEKVTALRRENQQRLQAIRADRDISEEKKQRLIAKAYLDLKTALEGAQVERDSKTATKRSLLERRLYGLPERANASEMISYRDALDRANQIAANDEAASLALMKRAQVSGDDLLLRAVLAAAYERQQVDVINGYSAANPKAYADVEELWAIQTDQVSPFDFDFVATAPAEIERWSEPKIADMAAQETE
jgi:hypothetical protein